MIGQIIRRHPGYVRVLVPKYCLSSGTLIALAADKIILSPVGCLGPIDPYFGPLNVPTSHEVLHNWNRKHGKASWAGFLHSWVQSGTGWMHVICDYAERMLFKVNKDHRAVVMKLLHEYPNADKIYDFFTHANHHCTPLYFDDIPTSLKLRIKVDPSMIFAVKDRKDGKVRKSTKKTTRSNSPNSSSSSTFYAIYSSSSSSSDSERSSSDADCVHKKKPIRKAAEATNKSSRKSEAKPTSALPEILEKGITLTPPSDRCEAPSTQMPPADAPNRENAADISYFGTINNS